IVSAATTSATGTYTLNVTDANGCTLVTPGTTSATVNPRPTIISSGSNSPVCANSALSFNSTAGGGTGSLTYAWSGPGSFTSTAASPSISSAATANSGIYTLTVTDGLGCHSAINTVAVTVHARPVISSVSNDGPICAGNTLNLMNTISG